MQPRSEEVSRYTVVGYTTLKFIDIKLTNKIIVVRGI